ncbi:MAG TPA: PTS sugar transporter subunit IIA, partial [Gammaproteobacteria bacterium]|nr:PTS sugar transporter subunit IIA [Gammaproteobacteria bacterium]
MTALRDIISPELILADSNATSKKRVLEQVAELCANPSDMDTFYQLLIEREKLGSTAVGEGVAIPHCRVP